MNRLRLALVLSVINAACSGAEDPVPMSTGATATGQGDGDGGDAGETEAADDGLGGSETSAGATDAESETGSGGVDLDGDGFDDTVDCDDTDPYVYPGAPELCDFRPNDCDQPDADEHGLVAFVGTDGVVDDLSAAFGSGTLAAAAEIELSRDGTLNVCEGTFYVHLEHRTADVAIVGAERSASVLSGTAGGQAIVEMTESGSALRVQDVTMTGGESVAGGAIQGTAETLAVELVRSTFTANRAVGGGRNGAFGGAVFVNPRSVLSIEDCEFRDNHSELTGGAVAFFGGTMVVSGSTFDANSAQHAGGVYVQAAAVQISDSVVSGNVASGPEAMGGGLMLQQSLVTVEGLLVDDNRARLGGGVLITGGEGTLTNSVLSNNTADIDPNGPVGAGAGGGALAMIAGATITLDATDLIDNRALHFVGGVPQHCDACIGGGFFAQNAEVAMNSGSVQGNRAGLGSAIYVQETTGSVAELGVGGTAFADNTVVLPNAPQQNTIFRSGAATYYYYDAFGSATFFCASDGCGP